MILSFEFRVLSNTKPEIQNFNKVCSLLLRFSLKSTFTLFFVFITYVAFTDNCIENFALFQKTWFQKWPFSQSLLPFSLLTFHLINLIRWSRENVFNLHLSFLIVCYFVEFLLLSERQGFFFVLTQILNFNNITSRVLGNTYWVLKNALKLDIEVKYWGVAATYFFISHT